MRLWNQALVSSGTGVCQAGDHFLGKESRPGKEGGGWLLSGVSRETVAQASWPRWHLLIDVLFVSSFLLEDQVWFRVSSRP